MKFGLVGAIAAAIHYAVAVALIFASMAPLLANVAAFLVAFQFSFMGHFRWSFRESDVRRGVAMRKFFSVAILSFTVNECLFAGLLRWTDLSPQLALLIVLVSVALLTFGLSKFWVFKSSRISRE